MSVSEPMESRSSSRLLTENSASPDEARGNRSEPLGIVFVTARFPGPAVRGDQVRAYQQLRFLGPRHRVTLVSFAAETVPVEHRRLVERLCHGIVTIPFRPARAAAGLLGGAFSRLPFQVALYQSSAMLAAVRQAVAREQPDVVHLQLARMAPYLGERGPAAAIVDLVDALSVSARRRRDLERGVLRWLNGLEAARLRRYEQRLSREATRALVASPLDQEAIGPYPTLVTVPNGVDLEAFPFERSGRDPHALIFTGNMGYFPNIDAACWLAQSILPRIRSVVPRVSLRIVGARPAPAVRRLAGECPDVMVGGAVADMHPHLRRAAVAVAPLRAGAGQLLKLLEAMASGTPIVATTLAARGIGARPDEHLLVADDPESFARQVASLLVDPALAERLAVNARRLVEQHYTWEQSARSLEGVYRSVARGARAEGASAAWSR